MIAKTKPPPCSREEFGPGRFEWRTIETAPMDGTVVLGFRDGQIAKASRVPRDDLEMWTFGTRTASVEYVPSIKPTHWMPLPDFP